MAQTNKWGAKHRRMERDIGKRNGRTLNTELTYFKTQDTEVERRLKLKEETH